MITRILLMVLLAALAACSSGKETSTDNQVSIVDIQPPVSEVLQVGQDYLFSVSVEYLAVDPGSSISLVIQQRSAGAVPIAYQSKEIEQGEGSVMFEANVTIPNTTRVSVFTPLSSKGAVSTTVVDDRGYDVEDNR